jgi:hypothetical protein
MYSNHGNEWQGLRVNGVDFGAGGRSWVGVVELVDYLDGWLVVELWAGKGVN